MNEALAQAIGLDLIELGDRIRQVDQAWAETLSISFKERGQLQPIRVRPAQDGHYRLTIGAHRYVAAQILGWTTISAIVVDATDDEARLDEVDENLFRYELTPFDQANFLEERRVLWEKVHGQIKRGGDRRSKVQIAPLNEEMKRGGAFIAETSDKFGLSRDVIKRGLSRKAQIHAKVWTLLAGTEAATNAALLDKIKKLPVEEQIAVAGEIRAGRKIKDAIKVVVAEAEMAPFDRQLQALTKAWEKADGDVRAAFLASIKSKK